MSRGLASRTLQDDDIDQTAYYLSDEGVQQERRNLNQALDLSPITGRTRLGRLAPSPRRVAKTAMSKVRGNRKYAGGKKSKKDDLANVVQSKHAKEEDEEELIILLLE